MAFLFFSELWFCSTYGNGKKLNFINLLAVSLRRESRALWDKGALSWYLKLLFNVLEHFYDTNRLMELAAAHVRVSPVSMHMKMSMKPFSAPADKFQLTQLTRHGCVWIAFAKKSLVHYVMHKNPFPCVWLVGRSRPTFNYLRLLTTTTMTMKVSFARVPWGKQQ